MARHYLTDGTNFVVNPVSETDSIQARKEKIAFLVGLNLLDVAKNPLWDVKAIRALATGLVPTMIDRKRLSKGELLAALTEFQTAEKDLVAQRALDYLKELPESKDAELVEKIYKLAPIESSEELATRVETGLKSRMSDVSYAKGGFSTFLDRLQSDSRYTDHKDVIDAVEGILRGNKRGIEQTINQAYKRQVSAQQTDLKPIETEVVMDYIDQVLSDPKAHWAETTYAIALATGRRMAEILGDHATWEDNEDGTISFTGLLKGKNRFVDKTQLPKLVNVPEYLDEQKTLRNPNAITLIEAQVTIYPVYKADRIVRAIDRLRTDGKEAPHEKVNGLYAKTFSSRKPTKMIHVQERSGLGSEFKTSRDFYAAYQARFNYKPETLNCTEHAFIMDRLHHNDEGTTFSYRKLRLV